MQLAKLLLVESVLGILFLAAVVYVLRAQFARWWATDWSVRRCVLVGVAVALVFRLPFLAMMLAGFDRDVVSRIDNPMWRILTDVDNLYGAAAAIWVLSFAAPVGEELVFRGLLLRSCLRHVSFFTANVLQAMLFAAMHYDLAAFPYLFAFGLAAGWVARRSGGLLAPMVMHGVFNLVVGLLLTA